MNLSKNWQGKDTRMMGRLLLLHTSAGTPSASFYMLERNQGVANEVENVDNLRRKQITACAWVAWGVIAL